MSLSIKRLAGETLVYGASTMVGRLLNWLLMPFYIRVILPEEYGVIVNIYGLISVLLVLFTYGLETGFFRFARDGEEASVYSSRSEERRVGKECRSRGWGGESTEKKAI